MFDETIFDREIDELLERGQENEAERRMLRAYVELKAAGSREDLEYIVYRLAHFYSTPNTEDVGKAENYFLQREALAPGPYSKYQTAMFYFYVASDFSKTIHKVDEIKSHNGDYPSYYSALALKGQALVKLNMFAEAERILEQLLELIRIAPSSLPHGDEINFLEAAVQVPALRPKCFRVLELVIPRMRSNEYRERAQNILRLAGYESL